MKSGRKPGVLTGTHRGKLTREQVLRVRKEAYNSAEREKFAAELALTPRYIALVYAGVVYAHIVENTEERLHRPIAPKRYTTWKVARKTSYR